MEERDNTKDSKIADVILELKIPYPLDYNHRIHVRGSYKDFENALPLRWIYGNMWHISHHLTNLEDLKHPLKFHFIIDEKQTESNTERSLNISFNEDDAKFQAALKETGTARVICKVDCKWEVPDVTVQKLFVPMRSDVKVIVVLGKRLLPNGEPSHILKTRMETACTLFKQAFNKNKDYILVTGGLVQRGKGVKTEAEVMLRLADKYGVKSSRVILEKQALSTMDNAFYSKAILDEMGVKDLTIITSDFHMNRSKMIFTRILKHYNLSFVEDHPKLSSAELTLEQSVEKEMIPRIDARLSRDGF